MSTFPPAKGTGNAKPETYDCGPASTGNGGIAKSLKIKAAGTKPAAGVEKDVNTF